MGLFDDDNDKKKKFKDRLLAVLEDAEVQEKLRAVLAAGGEAPKALPDAPETDSYPAEPERKRMVDFYQEKLREAKETISRLERENEAVSYEKNRLASRVQTAEKELADTRAKWQEDQSAYAAKSHSWQQELSDAKEQLRQQRKETEKQQVAVQEAEAIAKPFAEALDMYRKAQQLPAKIKGRVEAYFLPQTPVSFLVCAGQEGNMLALWDILKEEMNTCSQEEKAILLALLGYSIRRVNDGYKEPRYALRQDQVGARFDDRYHIRSKGSSNYSDPIAEVILPGIDRLDKKQVIKTSVVRI